MLSICIPIYNLDVTSLVQSLYEQAEKLSEDYEIILIDDGSDSSFKKINRSVCEKVGKYIELDKNVGRAKVRNLFLQNTKYEYLLFLDCDMLIASDDFLLKYIEVIRLSSPNVICGGIIYTSQKVESQKMLRWRYGILRESQSVDVRRMNPNKSFKTSNFVVHRDCIREIKFDERITKYGHEDTLFGYQLKQKSIEIEHIDNPAIHNGLESNFEFINKTEHSLVSLIRIVQLIHYDADFIKDVTLLNFYERLKAKKMAGIMVAFFLLTKPVLKTLLVNGCANLWLFDFYKLGFLCMKMRELPSDLE